MKKSIIAIVFLLFAFNISGQNPSVKDRWNFKFGVASQKTHNVVASPVTTNNSPSDHYARQPNFRLEANYGVLNWLEVGVYAGFFSYKYLPMEFLMVDRDILSMQRRAYAPSFGISANIHILPFFAENRNSRWEFYVPVRFGGVYLTRWDNDKYIIFSLIPPDSRWDYVSGSPNYDKKLRHEFGIGLGVAYYITNRFGFYMEALGGQFSYAPEMFRSPYAIRAGLTVRL